MSNKSKGYPRQINDGYEVLPLDAVKPHPRNPRRGDLDAIKASVDVNGFYGAVVANKRTGYILAGNHRWMAAKMLELPEIPVVWVDVGDAEEKRILAADNRTAELGGYDDAVLASLLQGLQDDGGLLGTGYAEEDLDDLLSGLIEGEDGGGDESSNVSDLQMNRAEELKVKWDVKRGQVWAVGRHRIMCGSCLERADIERLVGGEPVGFVYADPPYGISIVAANGFVGGGEAYNIPFGGRKSGTVGAGKPFGSKRSGTVDGGKLVKVNKYAEVIGDDTTDTALKSWGLLSDMYAPSKACVHVWWGGNYYADALPPSSCWLVWDKENTGNFADAELAWCSSPTAVRIFRHMWNGMVKASERGQKRVHPTQKPIALAQWCIENYAPNGVILDPFLGSGPTVVAAENLNRRCFGMELSPEYVAVNLERLSDMGLPPELIEEA